MTSDGQGHGASRQLRVLVVEDLEQDAILTVRELTRAGFEVQWVRVDTEPAMNAALERTWDLVLADYSMPTFSAPRAFALVKERGLDMPFIIVSGTMGEEAAVTAMRAGAQDYLLKGRLARLAPVVERELREARIRSDERRMREQLVISERMAAVGTLAAGVAHEINNPLAALVANLDFLARDLERLPSEQLSPELRAKLDELDEPLRDARHCAERVRTIVRDLRVFSHPGDSDVRGPVDIGRVLESAVRIAWGELKDRARLVKELADVPPVHGSEAKLAQVFLNLVVNACQALPQGDPDQHQLRLVTRHVGTRVIVEVCDTGSGISAEHLPRVFDPFFTTKPAGVGTGLGLAICHRIVSAMGGEITLSSAPGRGTIVRVVLPTAETVPAAAPASVARPAPRATQGPSRRILVVDDEPMVATAVRRMLAQEHDVKTTTRAAQALEWVAAGERFDLIICDVMMPEMNGMDLHREIARVAAEQAGRMLFMSGGAYTAAAAEFLERIPNPRIEKPFDTGQLKGVVRSLVA